MKQTGIRVAGVKLTKSGKLEKVQTYASVSDKLKRGDKRKWMSTKTKRSS